MKAPFGGILALALALPAAAEVRVEEVEFTSGGERLAGDLHLPDGAGPDRPVPAMVVAGAWMTVKEQMPARYARALAERGLAALAFDFRGWGRSGGDRRQFEDPARKVEDIEAALGFLATHPAVDATRLGGLGICVGAGYMAHAAARAPAMRALALVAPWLHDRAVLEETYGGAAGVDALLRAGDEAEARFRETGRQTFVPIASRTDRGALMFDVPYYTEPDRGLVPDWRNEADPAFWRGWLEFDGIAIAPAVARPVLLVHSEAAAIPQGARRFFEGLAGPKEALWLEGVPQFDFYDADGPVTAAADAAVAHFRRWLAAGGEAAR